MRARVPTGNIPPGAARPPPARDTEAKRTGRNPVEIARTPISPPRGPGARAPVLGAPRTPGTRPPLARPPLPAPPPSSRKPNLPPEPRDSEPGDDATSVMSRPQIDARIRAAQQPPVSRARPPVDQSRAAPPGQRTERTAVMPNATSRTPKLARKPGHEDALREQRPPPTADRASRASRPESLGAIALPRPPVQAPSGNTSGMSRPPVSQRTAPAPAPPGTVRTTGSVARKTSTLPPTPNYGSQPPRSAEPPPLDDLVPRSRSDRPRHTRPPVSHRSQPPRDRPRFLDRSPDPRPPGGGLPGPDSFGRLPAPIARYEPAPGELPPNPDETMAMPRGPYSAPVQTAPARGQAGEYYPPPQPGTSRSFAPPPIDTPPQPRATSRSFAPPSIDTPPQPRATSRSFAPPAADTYRDPRDPNEYYPHLSQPPGAAPAYDRYPPPGYLPPGDPRGLTIPASTPGSMTPSSAIPASVYPPAQHPPVQPGSAPYPYAAPPIENPSFMGLVLFAAPLALATLAVAFLALM